MLAVCTDVLWKQCPLEIKKTIDGMEGEVLFVLKQKKNKGLLVGRDISNIRKLHCVLNRDFKYAEVRI